MSDSPSKTEDSAARPAFTEREENVLKVAWFCLKSGPPEVDVKKLAKVGGFNTEKTASNTWGVIKKKLQAMAPAENDTSAEGANGDVASTSTPKKRVKKEDDGDADASSSAKKPRKTPTKKAKAIKEEDANEEEPAADEA